GAETVPFVAVACLCVSLQWVWHGGIMAPGTRSFGLALTPATSAAFFLTVPPTAYGTVTCDRLSLGFYALSAMGGVLLAAATWMPLNGSFRGRLALAAALGAMLFLAACGIAPQCLASPLAGLDPLLVTLWLDAVTEAQSFADILLREPHVVGGYYA